MLPEFAALFSGLSEPEIDALMQSFLFANCAIRHGTGRFARRLRRLSAKNYTSFDGWRKLRTVAHIRYTPHTLWNV